MLRRTFLLKRCMSTSYLRENIHTNLCEMFKNQENRVYLSQMLKIMPNYLTQEYVDMFCENANFDSYTEYVKNRPKDQRQVACLRQNFVKGLFQNFPINSKNIGCLEAYLHWLTNECQDYNNYNNNYLMECLNATRPDTWFQSTEKKQRLFIYHHGPTNSGKSTSAVEELKNLQPHQKGIYMAPLRLLAWEYQQKLGNCSLITGQEKDYRNSNLTSCTIESADLAEEYDVAVIDEIQMIGDSKRGWAWTKAILALKAKRIHLCGDERALSVVTKILQIVGDKLEERRYSRLSKLILMNKPFRKENIKRGDCIIDFAIPKLIQHRNSINKVIEQRHKQKSSFKEEQQSVNEQFEQILSSESFEPEPLEEAELHKPKYQVNGNYTALVHGQLPPECRKQQAHEFNSAELPYLVATNAIGMGLNLNIKKIVFMDIVRNTAGKQAQELEDHEIQQIAGRAGRGTETGYVQCANHTILKKVKRALSTVNQTYGIQLELQKDQTEPNSSLEERINKYKTVWSKKKSKTFNNLLNRQMVENEQHIKKAGLYFTPENIKIMKLMLSEISKKSISTLDTLEYLVKNSRLSQLYFMQVTVNKQYIKKMLENSQLETNDLLIFYIGLSLSKTPTLSDKAIFRRIQKAHHSYIDQFLQHRKVSLPEFMIKDYEEQYKDYQYIQQVYELQYYYGLLENYVWLWNKYEFVFYQMILAQQMKKKISEKISEILNMNKFRPKVIRQRPTWNKEKYMVNREEAKQKKAQARREVI